MLPVKTVLLPVNSVMYFSILKGIVKLSIPSLPISLSNVFSQIMKEAGTSVVNVYVIFHALFADPLYLSHD